MRLSHERRTLDPVDEVQAKLPVVAQGELSNAFQEMIKAFREQTASLPLIPS